MNVYGLTGGIASGKSTVSAMLRAHGLPIIDADQVARDVVAPGTPGLAAVLEAFGPGVQLPDGSLDREALGRQVFSDSEARARLNAIVHPLVHAETAERVMQHAAAGTPVLIMDIPLLFEVRDPASFAGVIVVYVDDKTQLERLMARNNYSRQEAEARIASQLSLEEKARRATFVIDNRGPLEQTRSQVDALVKQLEEEAQ